MYEGEELENGGAEEKEENKDHDNWNEECLQWAVYKSHCTLISTTFSPLLQDLIGAFDSVKRFLRRSWGKNFNIEQYRRMLLSCRNRYFQGLSVFLEAALYESCIYCFTNKYRAS